MSHSALLSYCIQCHTRDTRAHTHACMHAMHARCACRRSPNSSATSSETPRRICRQTHHITDEQHNSTSPTYMHNSTVQTGDTIPWKHNALPDGAPVAPACEATPQIRHPIFTLKNRRPAPSIYPWSCGRRPRRKNGLLKRMLTPRLLATRVHRSVASAGHSVHVTGLANMNPRSLRKVKSVRQHGM